MRGYASHRRRAEKFEDEYDEESSAEKHNRPALVPLTQLPPTGNTRQPDEE